MAALRKSEFPVNIGVQTETVLFVGNAVEDIVTYKGIGVDDPQSLFQVSWSLILCILL